MVKVRLPFIIAVLLLRTVQAEVTPRSFSVEVTALVQPARAEITLVWPPDPEATGYRISRKAFGATSWGSAVDLAGDATSFTQSRVAIGSSYEYQIVKSRKQGIKAYGYIAVGVDVPLVEQRGTVVLVVDHTYADDLKAELARLHQDLVGDGWTVARHDISPTDSPASVKAKIRSTHSADPARVTAVILFGHVPVPYSGNVAPDGHPNHKGAWPADVYYGDMDDGWTDSSVTSTQAERRINWNLPGDGKFDQSEPPSEVELQVGRVDLSDMTCFSKQSGSRTEKDLLRQYLNKDHAFRHGAIKVERRGLICNTLDIGAVDPFSGSGYRNLVSFFGRENVRVIGGWSYLPTLRTNSYLWSHVSSGGSFYHSDAVASSDDFALEDVRVVFTMFVGSYFGDWNNESNFLRAPLGSRTYVLTSSYSGQPHTPYHHMALGETIGYGIRLAQNNRTNGLYAPHNPGSGQIHIALMGDPTLRMHPVMPPSGLTGASTAEGFVLSWSPPPETELQGYHVYRATSRSGPFERISGEKPISQTTFTDRAPWPDSTYMIRAIKLERSASGTYFNPSQGIFYSMRVENNAPSVPMPPTGLTGSVIAPGRVSLTWVDASGVEEGFKIERKDEVHKAYAVVGTARMDGTEFTDSTVLPGTAYSYRVRAYNRSGDSAVSNEAVITSPAVVPPKNAAIAAFGGIDSITQGNWKGVYGRDGFHVIGHSINDPGYADVKSPLTPYHFWKFITLDKRALERVGAGERIAACWFSSEEFSVQLDISDAQPHRVALYFLDWDGGRAGRIEEITITDAVTGSVLDTRVVSDFQEGKYLIWYLSGRVNIRVTPITQNAVLSGIFFDTDNAVVPPTFSPAGGTFATSTVVTLSSATPGATIRYSLDGSAPDGSSPVYSEPIRLSTPTTIRAKAYKPGLNESASSAASFEPVRVRADFIGTDTATQGNWSARFGREGYQLFEMVTKYPNYVAARGERYSPFTWVEQTDDVRALRSEPGGSRGKAACCYSPSAFSWEFDFKDGRAHRLALYFLDWDGKGRIQTVEFFDAASGALLNSQRVSDFRQGKYLMWDVAGKVKMQVTKVAGDNAVLAGVFFDPVLNNTPMQLFAGDVRSDGIHVRAFGQSGQTFVLEASSNLVQWVPILTNTLTRNASDHLDTNAVPASVRFYRTRRFNQ